MMLALVIILSVVLLIVLGFAAYLLHLIMHMFDRW